MKKAVERVYLRVDAIGTSLGVVEIPADDSAAAAPPAVAPDWTTPLARVAAASATTSALRAQTDELREQLADTTARATRMGVVKRTLSTMASNVRTTSRLQLHSIVTGLTTRRHRTTA